MQHDDYETVNCGGRYYLLDRVTHCLFDNRLNEVCPCCHKRLVSKMVDPDATIVFRHRAQFTGDDICIIEGLQLFKMIERW